MWKAWPFGPREICCQKTALSFVDSVWEIFGPLLHGIPNVIISNEDLEDADRLVRALAAHRVTRIVVVPSLLRHLLDSVPDIGKQVPELKLWVTSGELLMPSLARRFEELLPGATLLNLYGSSEVAADVTWHLVRDGSLLERIPIGRPIANTKVYVLDRELRPVPIGVLGEIYVGGDALASGYLNNPTLTAQKFIPAPFAGDAETRLFKTGDLGRFLPDGSVEFLGRVDNQVKVRGVRIELGELESVLRTHPAVAAAVVKVWGDGGDERLIGYVVPNDGALNPNELRSFAGAKLPASMVPAAFIVLDALPLMPNGKVDRNALPPPGDGRTALQTHFVAPRTPLEKDLADIWSEILGVRQIGVDDDFFRLGGHSLLAMRVVSRVRSALQIELPLRMLFESPTVGRLARSIQEQKAIMSEESIALVASEGNEPEMEELSDEEVNEMLSNLLSQRQPE
jgi:acyl-coenzyme A synthetase/AMP-(fatty) acid ligase/acyl carrier protein